MRICLISYEFPPFVYGGAGTYAKNIAEKLADRGNELYVLAFGGTKGNYDHKNIICHRLGNSGLPRPLWIPSYWLALHRSFERIEKRTGGFDVVVGNGFSELSLPKRHNAPPRITVMHQSAKRVIELVRPSLLERIQNFSNEMGIAPLFDPLLVRRSDKIVAVSNFVKQSLVEDLKVSEGKIAVIHNGFNDFYKEMGEKEYLEARRRYAHDEKGIILFVGRINDRRKGLADLLKAFSLVRDQIGSKLLVAGSGDQTDMKAYIRSMGLEEDVNLLGKVTDEELHTLYTICDLYVSSSFYESFGLTLVEAMSAKKPIIARDIGGISEVVSNDNGILLQDCSISGLAGALEEVMHNLNKYEQIGQRNREYALEKFSWTKAAGMMERLAIGLVECHER
ncbi:MAG: glycosyltransferase family 4 protein [Candidatus Methanofastidiosa archaeon]|nr:glycosyltransferase family 4 protein [Candidatus Methanofastidiosa archaeon]